MAHKGWAVVTGASRGIGKAIAQRLAGDGYSIVGTYVRDAEAAASVALTTGAEMVQVDLGDPDQISRLLEVLAERPIHAMVNNAGVFSYEDADNFDLGLWRSVMSVNLDAIVHLTLGIQSQLVDGAAVVNISSLDGFVAAYDSMAYAASKAAVNNLTQSLAVHLGPRGIRVNAIAPGWIETDMNADTDLSDSTEWTPLGRNGHPDEIAGVVSFLCGPDSSFVAGQTLVVDGGYGCNDPVIKLDSDRLRAERKAGELNDPASPLGGVE
jgi:NAD(P)-dependent dehydrogenase (short-subunit alcohol dehydrogenase family)